MKKFKIISTCTSLVLVLALLAFGVYSANIVTFSISSTVSFTVQDVYIKVAAGLGSSVPNNPEPTYYYSQPAEDQKNIKDLDSLGDAKFVDEDENGNNKINTISYYLYIENLHSMDIHLMFSYEWQGSSKYNAGVTSGNGAVSVAPVNTSDKNNKFTFNDQVITHEDKSEQIKISSSTNSLTFKAKEIKTLIITLTMEDKAMVYKLTNGSFNLKVKASLNEINNMGDNEN